MTVSHWTRSLASAAAEADAVVVGGGICGIAAAIALQRRGLRVEVLERGTLACGASSRNAGFLMRGAAENYAAAIRTYGRTIARLVWKWTEDNLADLRAEGIRNLPSYRATPSCLLALEPDELAELRESLALLRDDGFAAEWLERGAGGDDSAWQSRILPPLGGLVNPGDAACNPVELMQFLAGKLGTPVREGCEVHSLARVRTGVEIGTSCGVFRAPRVLIATNAYAGLLLPSLADVVAPRRGQMLAIEAPELRLDYSYYANHGYEYFRRAADGTVVVGGCRRRFAESEVGYEDRTTAEVQGALEAFAAAMFNLDRTELQVTSRWAGTMGFSADGLPLVGPVDEHGGSVWFCGGFTGHGMSMAWRTAHAAVAAMMDGAPNPFPLSRLHEKEKSGRAPGAR